MRGTFSRRALFAAVAAAGVFCIAAPAWAHVTITAPGATPGGSDQEITFRVPVEKDSATVRLAVGLPTKTPIASVNVKPLPGWTHTEKTTKLATPIKTDDGDITEVVSQITWTASSGQGLQPGEFGEFTIIAGQLPDTPVLVFGTVQTYADGSVVSWNQTAAPGSTVEPEFPAPTLILSKAPVSAAVRTASTTAPMILAVIALVVAAAALGVGVVGNARRKASA